MIFEVKYVVFFDNGDTKYESLYYEVETYQLSSLEFHASKYIQEHFDYPHYKFLSIGLSHDNNSGLDKYELIKLTKSDKKDFEKYSNRFKDWYKEESEGLKGDEN
ncbi:MAG TPA: hypothetical protein VIK86_00205 [Candidatus Paceibacterota bacterium]